MRRVFMIFAVLILVASAGFAATPDLPGYLLEPSLTGPAPQWSIMRGTTFGVFTNELDAALNPWTFGSGPAFTDLQSMYIFGGLDNLGQTAATSTTLNVPFAVGLFMPGKMPWSAFVSLDHTGVGAAETSQTTTNLTTLSTIGTTQYNWISSQEVETNTVRPFLSITDGAQFLTAIGPFTTGLAVYIDGTDNADALTNFKRVTTTYYDTTPTAAPTTAVDQTVTDTRTNLAGTGAATQSNYIFSVPLYFKAGTLGNFVTVGASFLTDDSSTSRVVSNTNPVDPAGGAFAYNDLNNSTTSKTTTSTIAAGYALVLPGLGNASNKDNKLVADLDGNVQLLGAQLASSTFTQPWNYPGAGGTSTKANASGTSDNRTYATGVGFKVGGGALHSFYYAPSATVKFGVVPQVYLDYSFVPASASLVSDANETLTDGNANGVFTDSGVDSTNTVTTTFTNSQVGGTAMTNTGTFETYLSLPIAATFKPAGWIFGFTLGTSPSLLYQNVTVNTLSQTTTATTVAGLVGATTTTGVVNSAPTDPSATVNNTWTFTVQHALSLNFAFDAVKLDVILNLLNLFEFDNLTLQGTIALK